MKIIHVSLGGPEFDISVNRKVIHFEMHPYIGPVALRRDGEPLKRQSNAFLKAASLWAQQGKKVEDGLCVWFHNRIPIRKHLVGKHWQIIGYETAVRGS